MWGTPTFSQKKFPSDANVDDGTFISKSFIRLKRLQKRKIMLFFSGRGMIRHPEELICRRTIAKIDGLSGKNRGEFYKGQAKMG